MEIYFQYCCRQYPCQSKIIFPESLLKWFSKNLKHFQYEYIWLTLYSVNKSASFVHFAYVLSSTEYFWYSRVLSCAINKNWKFFCWCFRGFPSSFWFLLTSHYLLPWLENKSPADGKGTGFGNLDRSGKFSKCDWSSLLTAVTFSSFDWYSWKRKTRCLSWSGMTVKERELLLGDELKKDIP